jgi:peptide-methionine (S)-S-oxide reductase
MNNMSLEVATLAGGCFWCTEAVFKRLKGVEEVTPGYIGGDRPNPTYEAVCSGTTGHAEAVEIKFNPNIISFETLLEVFWQLHDPTTLNRQGNDVGTQYRSAIFYHNQQQKETAEASREKAAESYDDPIVTEITEAGTFYPAETYHRDYYDSNRSQGYCRLIIDPKIQKLYKKFGDKLADDAQP